MFLDYITGRWDSALVMAEAFIADSESGAPHAQDNSAYAVRGSLRLWRDDLDGALADHLRALELARERQDPQSIVMTLTLAAATHSERGELDDACRLVNELVPLMDQHPILGPAFLLSPWVGEFGVREELLAICGIARKTPLHEGSQRALAGDFAGAADVFGRSGHVIAEAHQRHHAGRRALEHGELVEAEEQLRRAIEIHRSVAATYYLRQSEETLAALQRESA
jgi:tetratricopeptide (TPR) repeat protein